MRALYRSLAEIRQKNKSNSVMNSIRDTNAALYRSLDEVRASG